MQRTDLLHVLPQHAFVDIGVHQRIAIAGDWHGDSAVAQQVIYRSANAGASALFQLGDFGLWPGPAGKRFLRAVESAAASAHINVYWLDGNHDDFDRLEARRRAGEPLTFFSEHVVHLARGTRWELGGVTFCAVGGATSLDRPTRTPHLSWWPQEELTGSQCHDITLGGRVDVLLTHDVAHEINVPGIQHRVYTPTWPARELERAWLHRERLGELTAALEPTHLFHGHFHLPYRKSQSTSFGDVDVCGLADHFNADANMILVDVDDLAAEVSRTRTHRLV